MSGEHVVYGFLRSLTKNIDPADRVFIFHYKSQDLPADLIKTNIKAISVPDMWLHWALSSAWEMVRLPDLARKHA